jgi:hypothetical protein
MLQGNSENLQGQCGLVLNPLESEAGLDVGDSGYFGQFVEDEALQRRHIVDHNANQIVEVPVIR